MIIWLFVSNVILSVNAIIWRNSIEIMPWSGVIPMPRLVPPNHSLLTVCIYLFVSGARVRAQGHRFDFGCRPTPYISLAAIFLVSIPQLFVVFLTLALASSALYHFFHRRLTFACHVASKSASPNGNAQAPSALTPSRADGMTADRRRFPRISTPEEKWTWTCWAWWAVPLAGVLSFAFGHDAVAEHRAAGAAVGRAVRKVVRIPRREETTVGGNGIGALAESEDGFVDDNMTDVKDTSTTYSKLDFDEFSPSSFATTAYPYDVRHRLRLPTYTSLLSTNSM
ncbi:hypothetical protein C8R45DRAFT_1173989 [Mycena sanguinolenta]|nr:hypothetical protein C8R45DRAFT_1173989 [Mycena sanguinolenta]